ncbi:MULTISPECIES: NIPSNAP family protein [Mycetocola]|uniref:NIPSNAP family containing protein n=1 Tax=Mycetocola lacteus TaxID=76637 RepID=A0A3L7ARC1_9MICO|nr:NIPSNAP family protein [Mycetocola lacteus]RLP83036.1 hypothetical protein D9V34_07285 [Mycetocola lacteus]
MNLLKTTQLRRYSIVPGTLDDFVEWWQTHVVPAREAHGFRIEFAYAVHDTSEFVWAVSLAATESDFLRVEAIYRDSPERARAFSVEPGRIGDQVITLVSDVSPADETRADH